MNETIQQEDSEEIDWFGILQVMADNLRLLVLAPLAAGLLALAYTYTQAPTYTATTKFLPPQQQQSAAATMLQNIGPLAGGIAGGLGPRVNPGDIYVTFLNSQRVRDIVIERLKLQERYKTEHAEDTRRQLAQKVMVTNGKDGLVAIVVNETDPQFAATLANTYVVALRTMLTKFAVTEAQQRRVFFEGQLAETKDNLIKAEQALKASGISSNTLKTTPGSAVEQVARLKAAITAQEVKLASMRGYLTESAPEFKQAMLELAALRNQLAGMGAEERTGKSGEGDYISKYRSFKYYETLLELFTKQYEVARLDESREGAIIQVLDVAEPPARRSSAKRAQIASVTAVGVGILLLIFVFLREAMNKAARNPNTAARFEGLRAAVRRSFNKR
jgi:uncharacterized protein involved in exopolysaccharide biosynthesis